MVPDDELSDSTLNQNVAIWRVSAVLWFSSLALPGLLSLSGMDDRIRTVELLHDRYAGAIHHKCLKMLGNQEDARDAVQETFLQAYRSLDGFCYGDTHLPWLYRIATTVCLKALRTRRRKDWLPLDGVAKLASAERDPVHRLAARGHITALVDELRRAWKADLRPAFHRWHGPGHHRQGPGSLAPGGRQAPDRDARAPGLDGQDELPMTECPSEFTLVGFICEDLAESDAADVRAHLESCSECKRAAATVRRNIESYEAHKAASWREIALRLNREGGPAQTRVPTKLPWWRTLRPLLYGAPALAVLGLLLFIAPDDPDTQSSRFKGDLVVQVVAKAGEQQFQVKPGHRLARGNALRFVITTARPVYVSVFSVDARGKISPFYPEADPALAPAALHLDSRGRHELPQSIVLDDAVGDEWLVVLYSDNDFPRGKWHPTARDLLLRGDLNDLGVQRAGFSGRVFLLPVSKVRAEAQ